MEFRNGGGVPDDPRKWAVVERDTAYESELGRECPTGRSVTDTANAMVIDEGGGVAFVSTYSNEGSAETDMVLGAEVVERLIDALTKARSRLIRCRLHDGEPSNDSDERVNGDDERGNNSDEIGNLDLMSATAYDTTRETKTAMTINE